MSHEQLCRELKTTQTIIDSWYQTYRDGQAEFWSKTLDDFESNVYDWTQEIDRCNDKDDSYNWNEHLEKVRYTELPQLEANFRETKSNIKNRKDHVQRTLEVLRHIRSNCTKGTKRATTVCIYGVISACQGIAMLIDIPSLFGVRAAQVPEPQVSEPMAAIEEEIGGLEDRYNVDEVPNQYKIDEELNQGGEEVDGLLEQPVDNNNVELEQPVDNNNVELEQLEDNNNVELEQPEDNNNVELEQLEDNNNVEYDSPTLGTGGIVATSLLGSWLGFQDTPLTQNITSFIGGGFIFVGLVVVAYKIYTMHKYNSVYRKTNECIVKVTGVYYPQLVTLNNRIENIDDQIRSLQKKMYINRDEHRKANSMTFHLIDQYQNKKTITMDKTDDVHELQREISYWKKNEEDWEIFYNGKMINQTKRDLRQKLEKFPKNATFNFRKAL